MVLNTMRTVRAWDLDTFLSIPSDQRDEIIKALNEDVNKLLSEIDPSDPLAKRLKDELRLTNEHFYDLLARAQKEPEPDYSNQFDAACAELVRKFEKGWQQLNRRVKERVTTNLEELERQIKKHKAFEDALKTLDVDVSNVKELYRQLPHPTPTQRAVHDNMVQRWQDIWELSRMYVERLKGLESVLNGLDEVTDIVRRHEITLASFDDMPAALERLRGVHAQLLELNMVLQQQENIVKKLKRDTATLRQHVARTRFGAANHPDVDQIEDRVSQITVRWDNVNSQVAERLRIAEEAQKTQMVYRSQYTEELGWLDHVEATIDSLRRPEELRPEELQGQLDQLVAEYAQLQEHTATIENINKEGGKFIRDAKKAAVKQQLHRQMPQPKTSLKFGFSLLCWPLFCFLPISSAEKGIGELRETRWDPDAIGPVTFDGDDHSDDNSLEDDLSYRDSDAKLIEEFGKLYKEQQQKNPNEPKHVAKAMEQFAYKKKLEKHINWT